MAGSPVGWLLRPGGEIGVAPVPRESVRRLGAVAAALRALSGPERLALAFVANRACLPEIVDQLADAARRWARSATRRRRHPGSRSSKRRATRSS
jgi:hypothetical protein